MAAVSPAQAQPADEFFRNKRELIFITSSNVGGGYDSYSRLLARYLTKYLPGNPRYVVQNMLGGGGIRAANFLYNVAPKDGSVIALIDRGMPTAPLLYGEKSQARFEAVKYCLDRQPDARDRHGRDRGALAREDDRGCEDPSDPFRRHRAGDRSRDVCAAGERAASAPRSA